VLLICLLKKYILEEKNEKGKSGVQIVRQKINAARAEQ
jgi:hypothetical protein